jgi:signal transduction histidine kinase
MGKRTFILVGIILALTVSGVFFVLWRLSHQNLPLEYVVAIVGGLLIVGSIVYDWQGRRLRQQQNMKYLKKLRHEMSGVQQQLNQWAAHLELRLPDEQEAFERLHEYSGRMARLIDVLQTYANSEQERQSRASLPPLDIETLLKRRVAAYRHQTGRQIALSIPPRPWGFSKIAGDGDAIQVVIDNVLQNAVKYSPDNTPIDVQARDNRHEIVIEVIDMGRGIPEDEIKKVWVEGERGGNSDGVSGSGLGLGLVRDIVQSHGGDIEFFSAVDKGTVVSIRLPTMKV